MHRVHDFLGLPRDPDRKKKETEVLDSQKNQDIFDVSDNMSAKGRQAKLISGEYDLVWDGSKYREEWTLRLVTILRLHK